MEFELYVDDLVKKSNPRKKPFSIMIDPELSNQIEEARLRFGKCTVTEILRRSMKTGLALGLSKMNDKKIE